MKSSGNQGSSNKDLLKGSGDSADETTGIPFLSSWRAVYGFVLGAFIFWVVILTVLTKLYK
jgi:hypothetical protein